MTCPPRAFEVKTNGRSKTTIMETLAAVPCW